MKENSIPLLAQCVAATLCGGEANKFILQSRKRIKLSMGNIFASFQMENSEGNIFLCEV